MKRISILFAALIFACAGAPAAGAEESAAQTLSVSVSKSGVLLSGETAKAGEPYELSLRGLGREILRVSGRSDENARFKEAVPEAELPNAVVSVYLKTGDEGAFRPEAYIEMAVSVSALHAPAYFGGTQVVSVKTRRPNESFVFRAKEANGVFSIAMSGETDENGEWSCTVPEAGGAAFGKEGVYLFEAELKSGESDEDVFVAQKQEIPVF